MKEFDEFVEYLKVDKQSGTVRYYVSAISSFLNFFNIETVEDIKQLTAKKIRLFMDDIVNKGNEKSYANSQIRPVKVFFNYLDLDNNPIAAVKPLKTKKRNPVFLTDEEVEKLVNACKNENERMTIAMLISLGLRRNELANLKKSNIKGNHVTIIGKGDKERTLYIENNLLEAINAYASTKNSEYIFSGQGRSDSISGEAIRQRVKSVCIRAGLDPERVEEVHPHVLRHTFATKLLDIDTPLPVIQKAMGHENPATTLIYAHAHTAMVDKAMMAKGSVIKKEN